MLDAAFFPYGYLPEATLPAWAIEDQAETSLRFATAAWHSDTVDEPPSTAWPPRILGDVEVAQDILGGIGVGGVVALTAAELVVADQDNWSADLARYSTADGRDVEIRVAAVLDPRASDFGTPLRDTVLAWRGTVRRVERLAGRRARVSLTDPTARLEDALQPLRYSGAGGLQGSAALADRPMPVCMGRVFNVAPVYLGDVDLGDGALPTFQTHWRAVVAHDAVRIRGVEQTPTITAPGVSEFRDYPALGVFQLGSTPDGSVTCGVRGEADGFPNTVPAIIWALCSTLGPQMVSADRDATSWLFAEADLPGEVGFYQGATDTRTLDAVQRVLGGCGAVLCGDRAGKMRLFDPFTSDQTMQFDIPASGVVAEPEPVSLPDLLAPAPYEVQVGWGANAAPISDIAAGADSDLWQRLVDGVSPVAIYTSGLISQRVAQARVLRLPAVYADETAAQARAEIIGTWLEGGARAVSITTDRYLHVLNMGDVGCITYPGYGLDAGFTGVVVAMREDQQRRRITVTLVGSGG
jgi:hypothetical protein